MREKWLKFQVATVTLGILFAATTSTTVHGVDNARTLVFAIDGLSYELFQKARARGLFPSFNKAGRQIAPYPSMTEPAWTEIMGGRKLFPLEANAKTVEASYFDLDTMETREDPREVFTRYANPYNFFRAFDYYFNPFVEGLMYFPNEGVNKMELDEVETEALAHLQDPHYISYIASVDAIAHTQKDAIYPHLVKVSATVEKVLAAHKAKGIRVNAWIVSDHGNEGPFEEGKPEVYITPVDLSTIAAKAGLELVSGKLAKPNQVAAPVLALANAANFYFKDLSRRRDFARAALADPTVELITFVEHDKNGHYVVIMDHKGGEARLHWGKQGYAYQLLRGNPLGLPESVSSSGLKWSGDKEMFAASVRTNFPDAPFRLVESATKQVATAPDLVLNFKRGFMASGAFLQYVRMVRTHGALNAASSLGVLASTHKNIPAYVRSNQVLGVIGLDVHDAFHRVSDLFHVEPAHSLEMSLRTQKEGIKTRVTELSTDLIFRRFMKIVNATMDLFTQKDAAEFNAAYGLYKNMASGDNKRAEQAAEALKRFDASAVLKNIDRLLALKDIAAATKDPEQLAGRLKGEILRMPGMEPLRDLLPEDAGPGVDPETVRTGANALRKSVMKLYTAPYLLDEILNIPEFDTLPDERDLRFASSWHQGNKKLLARDPVRALEEKSLPQALFRNVFQERKQLKRLYPATFPLLYNPHPRDVTVVYVPGIYNELFDQEIFSRGLRALRDNLGLRTLYADVDGRCSSAINSRKILDFLKADTEKRLERGYPKPRYLILGYSKGGVDTTEMLLLDPAFTRSQVLGLVSIASPHWGTTIVETADLPANLLDQVFYRPIPEGCRADPAAKSLLRGARESFWGKNLKTLSGLTRFYSLSFSSSVENAHPWMKITKNIARFQGPNDGVVTVESSRFPEPLGAVDLGVIDADHLAGILASKFPQDAFIEALLISLFELQALEGPTLRAWHRDAGRVAGALTADYYKRQLSGRALMAATAASGYPLSVFGPFPSIRDTESGEWYDLIAREQGALSSPVRCASDSELKTFAAKLREAAGAGFYALKPFRLICRSGKVMLTVETEAVPFYKFWESSPTERFEVKTLGDLVTALLKRALTSGKDALESGEAKPNIPKSPRKQLALPRNSIAWNADTTLNLRNLGDMLTAARIDPMLPAVYPEGITLVYDYASVTDFRKEYGLFYENTSPGSMDDNPSGYFPVLANIADKQVPALRMRSVNNSTRLTTAALRFKPADFPRLSLKLLVTEAPKGSDSAKGGSGKDDSAFQVWFNIRDTKTVNDRSQVSKDGGVKVFGYHWDERAPGGSLFENYYSNKNFVVATLPEAWQISIGAGADLGRWVDFRRDLLEDLRKAFPRDRAEDMEVVGITIQTDSNDTRSRSEAYFRELRLERGI